MRIDTSRAPVYVLRMKPGERLRSIREKRGLSQERLAELMRAAGTSNCTASWVSRFEASKGSRGPSLDKMRALCKALDLTPLTFFDGPERPSDLTASHTVRKLRRMSQ